MEEEHIPVLSGPGYRVTIKINSVQWQIRPVFIKLQALALAVRSHFFWRLCNKEWLTIDIKVCRKLLISCLHHRILHYVEIEDWQLVQSTTPCCCCLLLPMWIGLDCTNLWKIFDHWVKLLSINFLYVLKLWIWHSRNFCSVELLFDQLFA